MDTPELEGNITMDKKLAELGRDIEAVAARRKALQDDAERRLAEIRALIAASTSRIGETLNEED